jgi:hypothetical protein
MKKLLFPSNRRTGIAFLLFATTWALPGATVAEFSTPGSDDVWVRFADDCVTAEVRSTIAVEALETVFSDERVERIADLPRAASYIVRVAPGAAEAGLTITSVKVHPVDGDTTLNGSRTLAGDAFACGATQPRQTARLARRAS